MDRSVHAQQGRQSGEAPRYGPVRRNRVYEEVLERIQGLIASGELRAGDRLPGERELSAMLQVSRGSLRQALRLLEERGLIEAKVGGGTYIRDPDPQALVAPLALVLAQHAQTVRQLFEVRQLLEPALARMAAERAGPDRVGQIGEILERQAASVARGEDFKASDIEFHYAINATPANEVALRLIDLINDLLREGAPDIGREESPAAWLIEHRRIHACIAAGDGAGAEAAMREHLAHVARLAPLDEVLRASGRAVDAAGGRGGRVERR